MAANNHATAAPLPRSEGGWEGYLNTRIPLPASALFAADEQVRAKGSR